MAGRPLTDTEIASYDHLPEPLARRVRVHEVPWLPGRYVGVCLGTRIVLATEIPGDGSSALLAHELVHVRQWHEWGRRRFLLRYLRDFLGGLGTTRSWHRAYRARAAEVEAREVATAWHLRRVGPGGAGIGRPPDPDDAP